MSSEEASPLVEALRQRIALFGRLLSGNELRTRESLINPVLRFLGWDPEDPQKVIQEYKVRRRYSADYALLGPRRRVLCIVEAKPLWLINNSAEPQVLGYATRRKARCAVLTDGNVWRVYVNSSGGWQLARSASLSGSTDGEFASFLAWLRGLLASAEELGRGRRRARRRRGRKHHR